MPTCYGCRSVLNPIFQKNGYSFWACTACGLESVSPQPDDTVLARIYGDEHYYDAWQVKEAEAAVKHIKQADFSRFLEVVGHFPAGTRLLDCGAATGQLLELARTKGFDAYAVELSHVGAEACRKLIGADHVYEGEVQDAWFPANPETCFEVIAMFDIIEHVRDPRATLRWAFSHLRAGGSLLLVTPRVDSLSHHLMRRWWFHYHIEHLWYFSLAGLTALLEEAGFSIAKVCPVYKTFSLRSFSNFSRVYQARDNCLHPAIPQLFSLLDSILPIRIRSFSFPFPVGEMLVHARV